MILKIFDVKRQIFLILFFTICSIFSIRMVFWGILDDNLTGNELKKREKGQTPWDRFLFRRYYDVFPRNLLYLFFAILIIHPVSFFIVIFSVVYEQIGEFSLFAVNAVLYFDAAWIFIVSFFSWVPRRRLPGKSRNNFTGWIRKSKKK